MHTLHPAAKTVWTIKLGITWGIFLVIAIGYEVLHLFDDDRFLPPAVAAGAVLIVGTAICTTVPRLRYNTWRYELRPEELYLERGILNRIRTIVPLRRIQHLDVSQDILEREFDLGKLVVHTAGSRSSDVVLPGLQYDDAERLRDDVRAYILADASAEAV